MRATEVAGSRSAAPSYAAQPEPKASAFDPAIRPTASLAAKLLALYILLVVSRVLDVSPIWFLHIPLILLIALLILMIMRGELGSVFSSNISRWFVAFTAWIFLCFPFSTWRGASVPSVEAALQALAVYLIIAQLIKTEADWRLVAGAYAYAVLIASILSFFVGRLVQGRISLVNGSFADPNEFALILVVGLPFWWLKASRATAFKKIFYLACTIPVFVVFGRTGSRSGLLALCALFLIIMLFARPAQKVLMVVLALFAVVAGAMFLPEYLKVRYLTLFSPHATGQLNESDQALLGGDIGSSEGREMLLIQSIKMTFEHPVFGVGPGVFASASWDERKRTTGAAGTLLVSHNTYTQISSETGLPGFVLFAATLLLCFKYTFSDYRRAKRINLDLAKSEFYLFASLSALSVGIFFLSVGYTHTLAVMFALSASLHKIASETRVQEAHEPELTLPSSPFKRNLAATRTAPVATRSSRFRSARRS